MTASRISLARSIPRLSPEHHATQSQDEQSLSIHNHNENLPLPINETICWDSPVLYAVYICINWRFLSPHPVGYTGIGFERGAPVCRISVFTLIIQDEKEWICKGNQ